MKLKESYHDYYGGSVAVMDYDTQGRRIRAYDAAAGTTTLYYYSDNWQVLQERNGTSFTAYYVHGNYIDEVLLMHRAGADVFYLHDHLYSPVALLSVSCSVVERYEYDAYGEASILSANYEPRTSSSYANAYYFTGREVDSLDNGSLPLQYNRHRYLSQYMGRWYSHDPLGINPAGGSSNPYSVLKQFMDGINLYQYVQSDSIQGQDSFGLNTSDGKACCKIKSYSRVPIPGTIGAYYTSTSCTQTTINANGKKANEACKCHFRSRPDVKVYGSYSGECCWCTVKLINGPLKYFPGHQAIRLTCESKNIDVLVHTFPFGDNPGHVYIDNDFGYTEHVWGSTNISCDNAMRWLQIFKNMEWDWTPIPYCFGNGSCIDFASNAFSTMASECP